MRYGAFHEPTRSESVDIDVHFMIPIGYRTTIPVTHEQLKNCGTGHSSEDKTKHQQILDIMKVRQDIGGQGGYIALALKICVW